MVSFVLHSMPVLASYTATGQSCELSPDRNQPEILAICEVESKGIDIEIKLIGQRPNRVSEIQFVYTDKTQPVQVLKLAATPLIDPETVAIMFVDFNFDRHNDFAIMPNIQTGENVRYLYFLFQPDTGKFTASPEMDLIVNPEVMPDEKLIRSYWRETPTCTGWNLWKWKAARPYIATRIEHTTPCE